MSSTRRSNPKGGLENFLGIFSLGLGVPQLVTPQLVNDLIGVEDDATSRIWQRIVGAREIAAGTGILAQESPAEWCWARVAGDVMDLSLLSAAIATKRRDMTRLIGATGAVAGIMVADVIAAVRQTRRRPGHGAKHDPRHHVQSYEDGRVRTAITVHRARDEVDRFWGDFRRTVEWSGETVRFINAPGNRGTEIHVEMQQSLPRPVARIAGRVTEQVIEDDLRRFKQVIETGIVVRSDGSPEGPSTTRLLRQRPAQPLPEPVGAGSDGSSS